MKIPDDPPSDPSEKEEDESAAPSSPEGAHRIGAAGGGDPVPVPIEDSIDLHSFLPKEIESVVEEYLGEAHAAGFAEVRIIHGRGIGTQREIVRAVLARTPIVASFHDAPPERGGWGATLVRFVQGDARSS